MGVARSGHGVPPSPSSWKYRYVGIALLIHNPFRKLASPRVGINPDDVLRHSPEVQVGVYLPLALSGRLDVLVELADRGGQPTNRKELLAALIADAPNEPDRLADLMLRYRRAKVKDVLVPGESDERILDPPRPRGPRIKQRGTPPPVRKPPDRER